MAGCGEDGVSGADGDVAATEAELSAARDSRGAARAEARACFEAFRSCSASADECRAQLKACLPAHAPAPKGCSAGDAATPVTDAGTAQPAPASDASATPAVDADAGRTGRDRPTGQPGAESDAGARGAGRDGFGGNDREGERDADPGRGARPEGDRCRTPDLPHGSLDGCRDRAMSAVTQGMGTDAAAGMHDRCVSATFDERIGKLCTKARSLCATAPADAGKQAQVCAAIEQACSGLVDAGP